MQRIVLKMAHSIGDADYIGEIEQRVVDLEAEIGNLRQIVTRIGRERRAGGYPVMWFWWVAMLGILFNALVNVTRLITEIW